MKTLKVCITLLVCILQFGKVYSGNPILNNNLVIQKMYGTYTSDVIIYTGNMVEVVDLVEMATGKKIIVQPGAILKIDGQTITSDYVKNPPSKPSATHLWHGIEVLGNPNLSQNIENKLICDGKVTSCFAYTGSGTTRTYTNANPKSCLGNFSQGIVYCKNSTIQYSNYGVVAGSVPYTTIPLTSTKIYLSSTPARKDGGGLMCFENTYLINNLFYSLQYADYSKFQQLSRVNSNHLTLTSDFMTEFASGMKTSKFIAASINNFKFRIYGNEFKAFSKLSTYKTIGIYQLQSNLRIKSNTFLGLNKGCDILSYSNNFLLSTSYINDNTLDFNDIGLNFTGVDKHITYHNTFHIKGTAVQTPVAYFLSTIFIRNGAAILRLDDNANDAIGTITKSAFNFTYDKNLHYRSTGEMNQKNFTWGIHFRDALNTSGILKNNYFNGLHTASFVNGGKNNLVQVICNDYNNSFLDLGIENVDGTGIQIMGNGKNAAGNRFGAASQLNTCLAFPSSTTPLSVVNLLDMKYFFLTGGTRADPKQTVGVNKTGIVFSPQCQNNYYEPFEEDVCGGWTKVPGDGGGRKGAYAAYGVSYSDILDDMEDGISDAEEAEYITIKSSYDQSMTDMLNYYGEASYQDTLGNDGPYNDSIYDLLSAHPTFAGKYYLTFWYINNAQYTNADKLLDTIDVHNPTDTLIQDYCDYMRLLIDYATNDYSDVWLASNFSTFKTIADNEKHMMNGKAKVLVQFAADIDTLNSFHDSIIYRYEKPMFIEIDTFFTEDTTMDLLVYPNPFVNDLNIQITNNSSSSKNIDVKIYDHSGTTLYSYNVTIFAHQTIAPHIDTTTYTGSEFYWVKIMQGSSCIKHELISKE